MSKILSIKIQKSKGQDCLFKNKLNMEDPKQLALMLGDLESHGANIPKAVNEFKKNEGSQFPW